MISKKSFARLVRIVTGTFGAPRDETFSFEASLTRFERFVHFWVLVAHSFVRNRCPIRASALSYTTLLALIPMLAVAMSVSSVFLKTQGEEKITAFIERFVERIVPTDLDDFNAPDEAVESALPSFLPPEQSSPKDPAAAPAETNDFNAGAPIPTSPAPLISDVRVVAAQKKAASYIHSFIQNTYSGTLGGLGVVFLLWTAIVMLTRVEETFNDIWGVTRGRNWLSRVVLYWATITLGPLLLVTAVGLANGPHFQRTSDRLKVVPLLEPLISQLLPVLMITLTFALFYKLMPNTKVHFRAALVGGALAGTAWHLFNLFSLYIGSSAVSASKIYGSLALLPLLMLGLYTVWVIVLFGAQVAYAFQNRESYFQEKLVENVNQRGREFVALRLLTCIGQRFEHGRPPATIAAMSRELGIPTKLVQQVLQTLLAARLVVEATGAETGYTPARPLEAINCHHVLLAMRATQGQELMTREEPVREEVFGEFARIQAAEKDAASAVTMLALVNRAQARLEIASPVESEKETDATPAPIVLTELPNEPATATVPEAEPAKDTRVKETKPIFPANVAAAAAAAESSTDDDQSFPL